MDPIKFNELMLIFLSEVLTPLYVTDQSMISICDMKKVF
jgi:hypothetical protein